MLDAIMDSMVSIVSTVISGAQSCVFTLSASPARKTSPMEKNAIAKGRIQRFSLRRFQIKRRRLIMLGWKVGSFDVEPILITLTLKSIDFV